MNSGTTETEAQQVAPPPTAREFVALTADILNLRVVEEMLRAHPELITARDSIRFNWTGLLTATRSNLIEMIALLLQWGADINEVDEYGRTSLHVAASGGHVITVEYLVKAGSQLDLVDEWGYTALMRAAMSNHSEVVEFLLRNRANANIKSQDGLTASNIAQSGGHYDLAELLRAHETD